MSIFEDVKNFLGLKKKQQRKDIDTLKSIIKGLKAKLNGLQKRMDSENDDAKIQKTQKEYKAVKKLLKKSRKRLRKLKKEE